MHASPPPEDSLALVRARQQAVVADLGVRALGGLDVPALLRAAAVAVAETLGTEFVKVVELLPDRSGARLVAGVGWREGRVGTATIGLGRDSQAGFALESREPVIVDDLRSDSRFVDPPLLTEHGVVSGMSVILHGPHGSAFGVLGAHTAQRREFTRDDVNFLQGVANVLSAALHRQHVEDDLRRARAEAESFTEQLQHQAVELEQQMEEAQALSEELEQANADLQQTTAAAEEAGARARRLLAVATGLGGAITPEQVAAVVFREAMAAVRADAGSLALLHTSPTGERQFEVVHTSGFAEPLVRAYARFPVGSGPLSDAVLRREPQLLESADAWGRRYPSLNLGPDGIGYEAFAAVPVVAGDEVLAGLSFSFRGPMVFDEGTRTFLSTLGEQCGLALARARAFESERRARQASAFLAEASRLLSASLDYEATLRTVAESAVDTLGDWCAVDIVRNPAAPTWPPQLNRVAIVHRDPEKLALGLEVAARYPTDWSTDEGMASVLRSGNALFIPVVPDEMLVAGARDAEHLAMLRALRFTSIIVVPLLARGLTLGALTLCTTESGRRYDESDLTLARELAQRAAVAVDNARLYRDAEAARRTAEEANRAKSGFLATMSHELRTPLNAIAGHVQLLELEIHGPLTAPQREALERVDRAQRHLLGLINDVLNYARIESGRVEYAVEPVAAAEVVRDTLAMVEPQLVTKGLAVDVRVPGDEDAEPLLVWADREKLGQVLLNLLSNAIKFTPTGGRVRVEVTGRADGTGPAELAFLRVSDTGIGIPRDKLDAVFEPFVQVRSGFTRDSGGTGLGLSISRDLARGMGGDLRARSTEGKGSAFTVSLRRVVSTVGEPLDRRAIDERRFEEERRRDALRRVTQRRDG